MTVILPQQMMQVCHNFPANDFESITQDNTATGDGFAAISQSNDATIESKHGSAKFM